MVGLIILFFYFGDNTENVRVCETPSVPKPQTILKGYFKVLYYINTIVNYNIIRFSQFGYLILIN